MPVTAKLSRKFYEKLGDDVTNELVAWLNEVDATYRSELRELNELNFARFDAKLEQRIAEMRQEMAGLKVELLHAIGEVKGDLRAELAARQTETVRWMFLFWAGTALTVVGLLKL